MKFKAKHRATKSLVLQQDMSDCGVCCLASVIKYFGGNYDLEVLRESSGTSSWGVSMLGLHAAAIHLDLVPIGYRSSVENLKKIDQPVILHVKGETQVGHFIVCYGFLNGKFLIGDPAEGIDTLSIAKLKEIWLSGTLLDIKPAHSFTLKKNVDKIKKQWIWNLIKPDFQPLMYALLLGVIITILNLSTAIFIQKFVDEILIEKNIALLGHSLVLLFVILLIISILVFLRNSLLLNQSKYFSNRIVNRFYEYLLALPKSFYDTRQTGDVLARLNDTSRIQDVLSSTTGNLIISILILITSSGLIFHYHTTVGLIVVLTMPLYAMIIALFSPRIANYQRQLMASYALSESNFIDTIQGVGAIKAFGKENLFSRVTRGIYGLFQDRRVELGKLNIKFGLCIDILSALLLITILTYTSSLVINEKLAIGMMFAIVSMVATVIPAIENLGDFNVRIQEAKVAFNRIYDLTSSKGEYDSNVNNSHLGSINKIEIRGLCFRFAGQPQLLKNLNFSINKGEVCVLLGESGAGKTVILDIIQRFYEPEKGLILMNERNCSGLSLSTWRNNIRTVPQEIKIFNGTLFENIVFEFDMTKSGDVIRFCEEYGFSHYFERLPQGYLTVLGERGVNLSGGQKQLIGMARALYEKPPIVLLDEPTASLDRKTEAVILNILRSIKHECGILIVTHRFKTATIADKIITLRKGTITHCGSKQELLKSKNLYSELFEDLIQSVNE
ncbi:MAG: peptidase domain-containing ABC transporter [Cyclobacteriaceae bacterium]